MKYTTKIYNISLILAITLIIGILSSEAKKVPLSQLSAPTSPGLTGEAQDAIYRLDTGETGVLRTIKGL